MSVTIATSGLALCHVISQQVQTTDLLRRKVGDVQLHNVAPDGALAHALMTVRAPGAIVKPPGAPEQLSELKLPGPTLGDLLAAIVLASPDYKWRVDDGVVNLLPAGNIPQLLQVRIGNLSIHGANSTEEVIGKLLALPEVKSRAAELHLNTGLRFVTGGGPNRLGKPDEKFQVRLSDVTLLQALNSIVRQRGHGVWAYRETHWGDNNGFEVNLMVP
jgi:hypothetical protein